jgi:hypothetical protein
MKVQEKVKQMAAVQTAKAILRILPHVSEQKLLEFSLVQKGLNAVSYYPEDRSLF